MQPVIMQRSIWNCLQTKYLYNKLAEGACKTRERFVEDYSLDQAKKIWEEIIASIC